MEYAFKELLIKSAQKGLEIIDKDSGVFQPGENGPHKQVTTPVRNTAHWVKILLYGYKTTGDKTFLQAAIKSLEYLLSDDVRPGGYTYINRDYKNGDKCNGVIGQAWPIEALVDAYEVIGDSRYLNHALKIYRMHKFDSRIGLWVRCDVDGSSIRSFDTTLNHQIWFAASAGLLAKCSKDIQIHNEVNRFLENFENNALITKAGCFKMPVNPKSFLKRGYLSLYLRTTSLYTVLRKALLFKDGIKGALGVLLDNLNLSKRNVFVSEMEIGYHAFHTYGLAMLKIVYPKHILWESKVVKESLNYLISDNYLKSVMTSQYGIGYNPPGIEIAYSLDIFRQEISDIRANYLCDNAILDVLRTQFIKTYDNDVNEMNNVLYDKDTYSARLYELCRMSDSILDNKVRC